MNTSELLHHIEFRVFGDPAPQGSKKFAGVRNGRAVLIESSKRVKPWRACVEAAALNAMRAYEGVWLPLDGPLELRVMFFLPAPKTMPRGRTHPTTYPDLSKLVRSTEDALVTAGVVVDDSRFVREVTEKSYADSDQRCGARIRVVSIAAQGALV